MDLQERVIHILEHAVANQELAGVSVLVRKDDQEVLYAASGFADVATERPIRRNDIFRLYSQTKPVTAAAIMLLVERGQLDLMAGVEQYLSGFRTQYVMTEKGLVPVKRPVRVMDLLGMTAGLRYPDGDKLGQLVGDIFQENQRLIDAQGGLETMDFANRLGQVPLAFQPGEHFCYSTCADVLGAVVEAVDGRRFSQFLEEEFFQPLGMKDTAFWVPEGKRERLVTCYQQKKGRLEPWLGTHLCCGRYDRPPAFASGGAGLVSTLDDYAAFAEMLLCGGIYHGRRILAPDTVRFMTQPQLSEQPRQDLWDSLEGYSYGKLMRVCVEPGRVNGLASMGEYGWDGWLGTYFANFPQEHMTLLLMTNRTDTGTAPVTRCVRNAVLASLSVQENGM